MEELIQKFSTQLTASIAIANTQHIQLDREIKTIVICGLKGSGIGGEIIEQWLLNNSKLPIYVCHNYHLPAYVDETSLVIVCSYSGNTEETLSSVKKAIAINAPVIAVTSGGELENIGSAHSFPVVKIPGGLPPRAALAYPLVQLAGIMDTLKIGSGNLVELIINSVNLLNRKEHETKRKALELLILSEDIQLLFYAEEQFAPVLLRGCQQVNENGKKLAFYNVVSEMNHNEIVGLADVPNAIFTLMLRSNLELDRNTKRLDFTEKTIRSKIDTVFTIDLIGENLVAQTL